MWLHMLLFAGLLAVSAGMRLGWPGRLSALPGVRMALLVILAGNTLGTAVTWQAMQKSAYPPGAAFAKKDLPYEETLVVRQGADEMEMTLRIPEKEREEEKKSAAETDEEQSPDKSLQEEIFRYNQEKQDPDYY